MRDKLSGHATKLLDRHTTADLMLRRAIRPAVSGIEPADHGKDTIS